MKKIDWIDFWRFQKVQQGSILIVTLVVLVVMAIIAISSGGGALIEEQISNNTKNRQIAMQSAESIVRHAEWAIENELPFEPFDLDAFNSSCTQGLCDSTITTNWTNYDWGDPTKVRSFSNAVTIEGVSVQPVYFVELIAQQAGNPPTTCPVITYRIVGRGVASNGATSHVESIYNYRPISYLNGFCG